MALELRRMILFTPNLGAMTAFYRDVLGLDVIGAEEGWVDFATGGCRLALHAGKSSVGQRPPKLVFYAANVEDARTTLIERGLITASPVKAAGAFQMCDLKDPDGNPLQISSRA